MSDCTRSKSNPPPELSFADSWVERERKAASFVVLQKKDGSFVTALYVCIDVVSASDIM